MTSKTLTAITEQWIKFDMKALQRDLDTKVIEIAQQQEEGDQSRKRLIELSKEFKKSASEEIRKAVAPILKSFQLEIDNLSKRNKTLEQLFLNLYKQLIELPDPQGLFENISQLQKKAERAQDLEIENKQLRETLDEYNNEFAHVKNQEVTIKQLKEKIKDLEEKCEQQVLTKLKEKEKELIKQYSERDELAKNTQLDLVKKLGETEAKNLSLQSQLQKLQTEMFDWKLKQDELLNAKSCEIDLLLQDLDKCNDRAVNAERLLEQYMNKLREDVNEIDSGKQQMMMQSSNIQSSIDHITTTTLEIELAAKEKEITQLVDDIQKLQMKSNKSKELFEQEKASLEEKLNKKDAIIKQFDEKIKQQEDYDEVKRELNILKSIEFNQSNLSDSQKPLEVLLLEKNRHLQSENTQIKLQINDLRIKYDDEKVKSMNLAKTIGEQKQLISELERDLLSIAKSGQSTSLLTNSFDNNRTAPAILDLNSINSMIDDDAAAAASSNANHEILNDAFTNATNNVNNNASLMNIISSQRERFRLRIQDLEMESISYKQQLHILQSEIENLKADNLKLYEKIKFLQSYNNGDRSSVFKPQMNAGMSSQGTDEVVLNRYTTEYEQRLDPFTKFTSNERQKRYANLKLHDKFTLSLGRFILSNKTGRFIFFLYFLIIHLLIFMCTYKIASQESNHRFISAECSNLYKAHMLNVHGDKDFHLP